jgi:hypothetical protein
MLVIVRWIKRDYLSSAVSACGRVENGFEIAGDVEGRTRRRGGRKRKRVWRSVQSASCHCICVFGIKYQGTRSGETYHDAVMVFVHRDGNGAYPPRLTRCRCREHADRWYPPALFIRYFQREQADKGRCAKVLQ